MTSIGPDIQSVFRGRVFEISRPLFFLLLIMFIPLSAALAADSGPPQPVAGPGGSDCTYSTVISNSYGTGGLQYYLFEPGSPKPDTAPLIVFLHGYSITDPSAYIGWIEHIVKKGNLVIFPAYQAILNSSREFTPNAIQAVLDAIQRLRTGDHVEPDLDKFAVVGHSCGGILTSNICALAAESGLPVPKAVMPVEPKSIKARVPLEDLSKIPSGVLLLTVVGDQDFIAGEADAKEIFLGTPQIPFENKDFIIMVSDSHGSPPLRAGHYAPSCRTSGVSSQSIAGIDALDYYCLWKLFDALTDAAFYGKNREYALGNTPEQRFMGTWSDGTPVNELIVTDNP